MTSDISAPCLRCGRPSRPQVHHHRTDEGPVGRGMGGVHGEGHDHIERADLCDDDHIALHDGDWVLKLDGDIATGTENGMVIFERGMEVRDEGDDPLFWSDGRLAAAWVRLDEIAKTALELQATAAHEFYNRYRGFEKWYERAADIITQETGHYVHWRRVYDYVNLYLAFHDQWQKVEVLGKTLALAVADSREPEKSLAGT